MDAATLAALGTGATGLITAGASLWFGLRRYSGRVADTDAAALWDEGTAMRREYREEIARINEELRRLHGEREELLRELVVLKAEVAAQREEIELKDRQIAELKADREDLRARVRELETVRQRQADALRTGDKP